MSECPSKRRVNGKEVSLTSFPLPLLSPPPAWLRTKDYALRDISHLVGGMLRNIHQIGNSSDTFNCFCCNILAQLSLKHLHKCLSFNRHPSGNLRSTFSLSLSFARVIHGKALRCRWCFPRRGPSVMSADADAVVAREKG